MTPSKMTQRRLKYIVFLLKILLLQKSLQADPDIDELQCKKSNITLPHSNSEFEISCGFRSRALVKYNGYYRHYGDLYISVIQFNCYNATPSRINLPLNMNFSKIADTVQFNSCRFSAQDDILEILKYSLQLSKVNLLAFDNELTDNSLSRAHLKPLDGFVKRLSFNVKNLSTLPMDLFEDIKTLEALSIYSNSINSSYLSCLLAPLENLEEMVLDIKDLQEPSGSIFANKKYLYSLDISNSTMLPSGFFSKLSNLSVINLQGNYLTSLPNSLFLETKNLFTFSLIENKVALKQLPKGLLRDLRFLWDVRIIGCGLESIPADIFNGSKGITFIYIFENNLHELPLGLFADQEELFHLDLSRNMIGTLIEGLFDCNKKLATLLLSENKLTNLSKNIFKHLTQLRKLYLENNNLLTMSSDYNQRQLEFVFDNLEYLEELNLKNNLIDEISNNIMKNKDKLRILDLSYNRISSINCNFVMYLDLQIDLTGNPINCNCSIICIQQYIIQKPLEENSWPGTIRCEFPSALNGTSLYDVKLDELLCFPDIRLANISKKCTYNMRTPDSILVMNCSNGNFTDIPMLPLPDQTFSNGIELFMDNNPLTELSTKNLKDISLLSISSSPITELPKGFLSKLKKLKTVFLILPLSNISEDIFLGSPAIQTLKISGTTINSFPTEIFSYQQNLIDLDLSRNRLKEFDISCDNLEILKLSHNFIDYLTPWLGSSFPKLKKLFLNNNRLKSLNIYLAPPNLEFLNLEDNELTHIVYLRTFVGTLLLKNNSIKDVSSVGLECAPSYIDLSLNEINSIDLDFIGSFYSNTAFNFTSNEIRTFNVSYENITFHCDCETNSFVKDRNPKNIYESLRCFSPKNHKDRHIRYLPQGELLCRVKSFCPGRCVCWFCPANSTLIVNCSNASLTEAPLLSELETTFQNGIELLIEDNQLRTLKPHSLPEYKGVTKIFAAHNNITSISHEDIPQNITFLDISNNKIERLDDKVIEVIKESRSLRSILLYENPLICDCSSENLTRFILTNKSLFTDMEECGDGRKLIALTFSTMCSTEPSIASNIDKLIWIPLVIILSTLLFLTFFYFKKKESILIWLYAHNLCLCCVTEEELDKDKKYDAFISYSSLDADFVALNLVSKLESGPKPYKLCLHERDWLGGGYIPYQIEKSVDRSRRTLIVMSQNYVNSRWTRMEFRTAHNASMNEKRPRVIVVMIDDKVDLKDLDSDLRKYIKMYTYLRWGDAWFWNRLKYALPHPSKKNVVKTSELDDADAGTAYSSDENELF